MCTRRCRVRWPRVGKLLRHVEHRNAFTATAAAAAAALNAGELGATVDAAGCGAGSSECATRGAELAGTRASVSSGNESAGVRTSAVMASATVCG